MKVGRISSPEPPVRRTSDCPVLSPLPHRHNTFASTCQCRHLVSQKFPLHLLLHLLPRLPTYMRWEKAMWKVSRRSSLGRVRLLVIQFSFFRILMTNWVDISPLPHRHMPYAFCQCRHYVFFLVHLFLHLSLWIPTYIRRGKG